MNKLILPFAIAALAVAPLAAQRPAVDPAAIEGLVRVPSTRLDAVYLMPGVDFRTYTKIKLDPTEVSFRRNWQRDFNRSTGIGRRISDSDVAAMAARAQTGFEEIFAEAYRNAGFQVVTEAGPDVLRLRTGVINLFVNAPDVMSAGRVRSYSVEAGEATLVIEARDSQTGALLGRAFDRQTAGDTMAGRRTSVSNQADFEWLFRDWARTSVRGLEELKAQSPITDPSQVRRQRR